YAVDLRLSMSTEIPFEKVSIMTLDDCFNFIKILLKMRDDALFVCGTNAHNPVCRMYKLPSLEFTGEEVSGTAKCPYDARHTAAAVYAGGKLYSATVTDFLAVDTVIYQSMGDSYPLRTVRLDSKWLKEPVFIDALEYGEFVYFFFREIAAEFGNLGKLMVSRVARVCKNDAGGSQRVLERHWTSFVKTRLNCSVPGKLGEPHFYFNELQAVSGVVRISDRDMVVAVFTTPPNSIFGSAVCAFHMEEIDRALDGRLQEQRTPDSYWTLVPEDNIPQPRPGTCARRGSAQQYQSSVNFPDPALAFIKTHTQAASAVPSTSHRPWLVHSSSRYFSDRLLKISIDPVAGPWGNRSVLYLGSEHGLLLKVLVRPGLPGLVLEEIHVYNPHICGESGSRDVRGLQIDASRHTIYVAFAHCLLRLPLSRCERHGYCQSSCLASRDPYCGWKGGACVQLSTQSRYHLQQELPFFVLDILRCDEARSGSSCARPASGCTFCRLHLVGLYPRSSFGMPRDCLLLPTMSQDACRPPAKGCTDTSSCRWKLGRSYTPVVAPDQGHLFVPLVAGGKAMLARGARPDQGPDLTALPTPDSTPVLQQKGHMISIRGDWGKPHGLAQSTARDYFTPPLAEAHGSGSRGCLCVSPAQPLPGASIPLRLLLLEGRTADNSTQGEGTLSEFLRKLQETGSSSQTLLSEVPPSFHTSHGNTPILGSENYSKPPKVPNRDASLHLNSPSTFLTSPPVSIPSSLTSPPTSLTSPSLSPHLWMDEHISQGADLNTCQSLSTLPPNNQPPPVPPHARSASYSKVRGSGELGQRSGRAGSGNMSRSQSQGQQQRSFPSTNPGFPTKPIHLPPQTYISPKDTSTH
uniref:Semaphorin 6A n=1 Tax=Eptatretus burgeri TaxID=7764 RepID=A0A8C4R012_EPTBU